MAFFVDGIFSIEIPLITAEQILTDRNLPKSLTGDLLAKSSILFAGVNGINGKLRNVVFNDLPIISN